MSDHIQLLRLLPITLLFCYSTDIYCQSKEGNSFLNPTIFDPSSFQNPPLNYGPFTRWWWPGNDVTKEEIKREIQLFASNHFGGVEIQPFSLVFPTKGQGRSERIMSYDTPAYYENIKYTLQEAEKASITVDLTNGSGWPPGGSHILKEDNNLSLEYGITAVPMNSNKLIKIPRASYGDDKSAKLVKLLAARITQDTSSINKSFILDPKSTRDITTHIKDSTFHYHTSDRQVIAIAFWSVPTMEKPMIIAKRDPGFVFNHFDSTKVRKNYDYLFGDRTGLKPYFGKSLRAIFNDSYEFKANRHFSDDFITQFRINRGYDISSYLPANMWFGYNNMYARMEKPGAKPMFVFSDQDWRLRYDYDLTLSDLLGKHFLQASKDWTESRGLVHRTQAYGLNMDIIGSAGLASIPEVETMLFSKGSENGYKLITSGGHLYNKPIISAESGVYFHRAYMTTPQKLKLTIDKLLSSGVNQLIYHGTPYRYYPEGYPKEGWFPFYNSALGINFSSNLNENNPFWKYIGSLNRYVQRAQYVLRSGKPNADVLIYYPFLNYSESSFNNKEVLISGVMKTEPSLPIENKHLSYSRDVDQKWLEEIMPFIDKLNAKGITWDWINDASIQEMEINANKKLDVRGNLYQSIVLFDLPYIQLKSAKKLNRLSKQGASLLTIGNLPKIQPSFLNYKKNDKITEKEIKMMTKSVNTFRIETLNDIGKWEASISTPISYYGVNENLRQIRRKLDESSYAQFIWNESDQWTKVLINNVSSEKNGYWMNADDGTIIKAILKDGIYGFDLGPFSSIIFLSTSVDFPAKNFDDDFSPEKSKVITNVSKWNIETGDFTKLDTLLFDWKENKDLKYNSKPTLYKSTFEIESVESNSKYYLDLGEVLYSADVVINGKFVGSSIYKPFNLDITSFIKPGNNTISVTVTNAAYNDFVGQAENGEKVFKKLKGESTMSAGLLGPVIIYEQK